MYGEQIFGFFHNYYRLLLWIVVAVSAIGAIAALYWTWRRKRQGKSVIPDAKEPSTRVA
jgi:membrane protein DedA with SNARE-associated domain